MRALAMSSSTSFVTLSRQFLQISKSRYDVIVLRKSGDPQIHAKKPKYRSQDGLFQIEGRRIWVPSRLSFSSNEHSSQSKLHVASLLGEVLRSSIPPHAKRQGLPPKESTTPEEQASLERKNPSGYVESFFQASNQKRPPRQAMCADGAHSVTKGAFN